MYISFYLWKMSLKDIQQTFNQHIFHEITFPEEKPIKLKTKARTRSMEKHHNNINQLCCNACVSMASYLVLNDIDDCFFLL